MKKIYIVLFLVLVTVADLLSQTWSEWGKGFDRTWSSLNDNGSVIGTVLSGVSTPYLDSMYVVLDNTDGNGTLTNYPNLIILNANNFGSGASKNYFTREDGTTFRFIRKTGRTNVPFWVQSYSTAGSTGRIWVKTSNTSASKDTLILFCNNGSSAPDSSHLEVVFPAGDDFNGSSFTNLTTVDNSVGVFQIRSRPEIRATGTAGNLNCRVKRTSNLIYYGNDALGRKAKVFAGVTATTTTNTDSAQIAYFYASTIDQCPYTLYATAVISNKANSAGCDDPQVILKLGSVTAEDSIFLVYFNDSTLTANDGIFIQATGASNCTTWTEKRCILQNLTNVIRKPVIYYEDGFWFLLYEFNGLALGRSWIGVATCTESNPRSEWTVVDDQFIAPNFGATAEDAWDSTRVSPVAIMKKPSVLGDYWISYEGRNSNAAGVGGLFYSSISEVGNPSQSTFSRYVPSTRLSSLNARPLQTFYDSMGVWTGRGGFDFQPSSDSGSYRFDYITDALTLTGYGVYGRGMTLASGITIDTVRGCYMVKDSSGDRIHGAATNSDHPTSIINSGGAITYAYNTTNDFEVVWEQKVEDWRIGSGSRINTMFSVGDLPVAGDSVGTEHSTRNYVWGNNREGILWERTALSGSNYFSTYDSAGTGFVIGRFGFVTNGDTNNANHDFRKRLALSPITYVDNYTTFRYRYPDISTTKYSDSVITVWANDLPMAQHYDGYDAVRRDRTKTHLAWSSGELSTGAGGKAVWKYWFLRPIQNNYREPVSTVVKYNATLGAQDSLKIGQGTDGQVNDSSYVNDNYLVYSSASNAFYNGGGATTPDVNCGVGFATASADECRMILRFNMSQLPATAVIDSAVLRIYCKSYTKNASDADGILITAYKIIKDWTEGNRTSLAAGSQATMSSFTRRGTGTGVGGTTIAASDSNWFTQAANFSASNKENFSHIWGIGTPDTITISGVTNTSYNTLRNLNVTNIVKEQIASGVNYGILLRDISTHGSSSRTTVSIGSREETDANIANRPMLIIYYKLAS